MAKPLLEKEMEARILRYLENTWQAIAPDALDSLNSFHGEYSRQPKKYVTMSRAAVIELVLDCDYVMMYGLNYGEGDRLIAKKEQFKNDMKVFNALTYDQMKKIARKNFPAGRYS